MTDSGKILNFEELANVGLVEALAYQVAGGEARAARKGVFGLMGDDMRKHGPRLLAKLFPAREPRAVGATYNVIITPMIPKAGPGYAPGTGYTHPGGNGGHAKGNGAPPI